ncbi:MAG: hypothetical protein Q8K36_05960 [Alphaproteobacteria bacterium]|nr:hypothetical protein [Alphaproteobacteria bacterium]
MRFIAQNICTLFIAFCVSDLNANETAHSIAFSPQEVIENESPLLDREPISMGPISIEAFASVLFGGTDPYHVGLVEKGVNSVPNFMPTESCARIVGFFLDHSLNKAYTSTQVPDMIRILGAVDPKHYISFAMHVISNFTGPYHLSREGAMRAYCQHVNFPVYKSPSITQKQQVQFIATAFAGRPEGSLSSAHFLNVMRIFAKLKNDHEYEQFSSFVQGLPHYDSYHYLLTLETMGNMPIGMLNDTLKAEIFQFAQTHHPQNIPYELMRRLPEV